MSKFIPFQLYGVMQVVLRGMQERLSVKKDLTKKEAHQIFDVLGEKLKSVGDGSAMADVGFVSKDRLDTIVNAFSIKKEDSDSTLYLDDIPVLTTAQVSQDRWSVMAVQTSVALLNTRYKKGKREYLRDFNVPNEVIDSILELIEEFNKSIHNDEKVRIFLSELSESLANNDPETKNVNIEKIARLAVNITHKTSDGNNPVMFTLAHAEKDEWIVF